MMKSLGDQHSCVSLGNIKIANFNWIAKKLFSIINIDPNISNDALDKTLDKKF